MTPQRPDPPLGDAVAWTLCAAVAAWGWAMGLLGPETVPTLLVAALVAGAAYLWGRVRALGQVDAWAASVDYAANAALIRAERAEVDARRAADAAPTRVGPIVAVIEDTTGRADA